MSHDDHGHGGKSAKPSSPFFIIGVLLFITFFSIQSRGGGTSSVQNTGIKKPAVKPQQKLQQHSEPIQSPTYNENILNTTGLTRAGDEIKKPQVGSFVTWGFSKNFLKGLSFIPVIRETLDNSTTYSTKNTLHVLNNKVEAERNLEATLRLTDKSIQDNYMKLIPDELEFKDSANHVNCFTDEDGGSDHKPTGGQVSQSKSPGAAALTESAMALHSTVSIGTLPLEQYNWFSLLSNQLVGLDNGLPCGTKDLGTHVGTFLNGDAHVMEYDGDNLQWTATNYFSEEEISRVLSCLRAPRKIDPKTGKEEEVDCGDLTKGFGAITEFSTLVPHADDLFKWFGRGPKSEKEGFTYFVKPEEMNNPLEHGRFSQAIDLLLTVFSGTKTVDEAIYAWEAGRRWDRDMFDCGITPKEMIPPDLICPTPEPEKQRSIPPNEAITSSKAGNISTNSCKNDSNSSGKIVSVSKPLVNKTATKFNIPSCALDGVAFNEGAYIPTACVPNQCGAMGPFQITVGHTYETSGTGQCTESNNCSKCSGTGGNCPNSLQYYVPGTDPCDPIQAAEAAAKMLIGKSNYFGKNLTGISSLTSKEAQEAIVTAGDSYFGSTTVHYPGGCSYGEAVYQKCNPSYKCQPHTFPSVSPIK